MESPQMSVSLWLRPAGAVRRKLEQIIAELSAEFGTPYFTPHVTVLGSIENTPAELQRGCSELMRMCGPCTLELGGTDWLPEYFRCLFAHVRAAPELLKLHAAARAVFGVAGEDFMPHLSLMYGAITNERKRHIAANLPAGLKGLQFTVDEFELYTTGPDPAYWHKLGSYSLRGG